MRTVGAVQGARTASRIRLFTCVTLCVLLAPLRTLHAQDVVRDRELAALRAAVEHAQFELAQSDARSLLARDDLSADQRNDTLELLAIAQIAARDEVAAQDTLRELYRRDPEHAPKLRDPGPQVEAAFARAHSTPRATPRVEITTAAVRDAYGRTRIELSLGEGRDAVESVDLFATAAGESMHLVADVVRDAKLALTLPALPPALMRGAEPRLSLYVEARAPSGFVLGRDGTRDAPLVVRLEPMHDPPAPRRWWVWTGVAIAVAGVAVGSAIAAH